nr:S8 family serine peptidase [Cohnella fermenti]
MKFKDEPAVQWLSSYMTPLEKVADDAGIGLSELQSLDEQTKLYETDGEVEETIAALQSDPRIEYAQPNYLYSLDAVAAPNDTYWSNQWGMTDEDYGIDILEAWGYGYGSDEVVVATLDTGIDVDHPDLVDRLASLTGTNLSHGPGDSLNLPVDKVGHGTHVAGIIAATANNSIGVAGVAPGVEILPVNVSVKSGNQYALSTAFIRAGIDLAVARGAKVLNMSFGSEGNEFDTALYEKMSEYSDILYVAAAGNDGANNDEVMVTPANFSVDYTDSDGHYYPALPNIITVASVGTDALSSWSDYGVNSVHLAAPGEGIVSTIPDNTYGSLSGTSMAAPQVSGAAALLYSLDETLTPVEVIDILTSQARQVAGLASKVKSGGTLDAGAAVGYLANRVASATATPAGGDIYTATPVTLSTTTEGASIYYTTDGRDPDPATGTLYEGPIQLTQLGAVALKARAYKEGSFPSAATSFDYSVAYDENYPGISLKGANPMTVEANGVFADPGATAWDLQDGDLTDAIAVTGVVDTSILGTYTLEYNVVDSDDHAAATVTRTVIVQDTQPPVLELLGDASMSIAYGSEFVDPGVKAMDAYYGDLTSSVVVTGTVNTSLAGSYTLRYHVQDPSGNAAEEATRTVIVSEAASSSSGGSGGGAVSGSGSGSGGSAAAAASTEEAASASLIDLNGSPLDPNELDLTRSSIPLEVTPDSAGIAYVSLPLDLLNDRVGVNDQLIFEIKAPYGSYRVPAKLSSLIAGLDEVLNSHSVTTDNAAFKITLTDYTQDQEIRTALTAKFPDSELLGAIVDYRLEIVDSGTGESIAEIGSFGEAIERTITLTGNSQDLPKQWGAYRYDRTTGTFEFVPARAVVNGGTGQAVLSSYTNSIYLVAANPVSFLDMTNHWGKAEVELSAAKALVAGIGNGLFAPNQSVTRAEFAAMLVRALSRGGQSGGSAPYADVPANAWYYDEVAEAKQLGLLDIAVGTRFYPQQALTREEMASMLAAAVRLEQSTATALQSSLDGYRDIGAASAAYLEDIGLMVELGIMTGTGADEFRPQDGTTRAQAAVVLNRMLRTLGMMD